MEPDIASIRARIAWKNSRLNQRELAQAAGIKYSRLRAILGEDTRASEPSIEELWALADASKIPRWFMEHGFEYDPMKQTVDQLINRILELEREIQALKSQVADDSSSSGSSVEAAAKRLVEPRSADNQQNEEDRGGSAQGQA